MKKNLLAGFVNADRLTLSKQELANCFDLIVSGSVLLCKHRSIPYDNKDFYENPYQRKTEYLVRIMVSPSLPGRDQRAQNRILRDLAGRIFSGWK